MDLFSSFSLGKLQLANRMVMAPMTRGRAELDGTPNDIMVRYYRDRSSAGLIVSEATAISMRGVGWYGAPAIFTDSHVKGWRSVTAAVHQAGGKIFLQLWHMGRVSHPDFLGGALPVAPSAIAASGETHTPEGKKSYVVPRALSVGEISETVAEYAQAAKRAIDAGFDGIEIHGANGYLIDQFLRDSANQRSDQYGGSIENRARFLFEVVDAVCATIGSSQVGIRVSPRNTYNSMTDSDPVSLFRHVAQGLNSRQLAYLHVMEPVEGHPFFVPGGAVHPELRKVFKSALILNGGLDCASGNKLIAEGAADLIAFGLPFLANPDLVRRYQEGLAVNQPDFSTLYSRGEKGYNDYPQA